MKRSFRAFLLMVFSCLLLQAQDNSGGQPKFILVKAGHLIDVRQGQTKDNQAILIEGDHIKEVGPLESIRSLAPKDAETVDLGRTTVLPGLIDCHDHLTVNPEHTGYASLGISIPRETLFGVRNAERTIEAGFTTVRNVGAGGFSDVALRDAINDGDITGPRLLVSGPALGITGGHCDNNLLAPEFKYKAEAVADGPWAVRTKVREVVKYGADLIKICATGGVLSKGDQPGATQYTLEEIQAIVEEAHKLGRKVSAHAHGGEGIKIAIRAGVDSIEHASLIDDEGIQLAKQHGTYLVMDIYNDDFILQQGEKVGMLKESIEKERKIGQLQRDNFARAVKGGAKMAFGTDGGVYPHGENAKQFAYMVKYGMPALEAIRAATVFAADLLGWQDRVGAVEPGKLADIIAVDGDPLRNIIELERVKFVMKGGRVLKNEMETTAGTRASKRP